MMKTNKSLNNIPIRRCVVSYKQYPKNQLIRIVKNNEGQIFVDLSKNQKANGHGMYFYPSLDNLILAKKKKIIERNFKINDGTLIYDEIERILKNNDKS